MSSALVDCLRSVAADPKQFGVVTLVGVARGDHVEARGLVIAFVGIRG